MLRILTELSQVLLPVLCPKRIVLLVLIFLLLTARLLYFKHLNTMTSSTKLSLTTLISQGMLPLSAAVDVSTFCQDSSFVGASLAISFRWDVAWMDDLTLIPVLLLHVCISSFSFLFHFSFHASISKTYASPGTLRS